MWPTFTRPALHVATDEPSMTLPESTNYEKADAKRFGCDFGISNYIRDFVLLQHADYLPFATARSRPWRR